MLTKENLNEALADAVMDRPREFYIGKKRYCLWSPSLGQTFMLDRNISALGIDSGLLKKNPNIEVLRLAKEKRNEVCRILAILSFRTFKELSDSRNIDRRTKEFVSSLTDEEIAQLLLIALSEPKAEMAIEASGLSKEHNEQARIVKYKNRNGHSLPFGGKTIYGSLIGIACEKFGWTKEYVVWGIDLFSLRMMLADTVNSVYLSDEEMKALGISSTHTQKFGMTPEDIAKLKAMDCWE